jgi:hypothetical protein
MSGPYYNEDWNQHVHTPGCCEASANYAVFLAFSNRWDDEGYNPQTENPLPGDDWEPKWKVACYERWSEHDPNRLSRSHAEAKFCPFCGQALPEIVRVEAPGPVVRIIDGGYYCEECGERADSCECLPPDVCWRVRSTLKPRVKDLARCTCGCGMEGKIVECTDDSILVQYDGDPDGHDGDLTDKCYWVDYPDIEVISREEEL